MNKDKKTCKICGKEPVVVIDVKGNYYCERHGDKYKWYFEDDDDE